MKPAFFLLMSGIRESNPPPRLGKPVHYRCANSAYNKSPDFLRADTRTRTGDLRITNALLYQLSHIGNLRINQLKKSTPAGARTLDTLIKSQVLYQLSYGCIFFFCGCKGTHFFAKVHTFFETTKLFPEFLQKSY